jgi:hypothetical protein
MKWSNKCGGRMHPPYEMENEEVEEETNEGNES